MFALPIASDGTSTSEECLYCLGLNISHIDLFSQVTTESIQVTLGAFEVRSQRLAEGHVLSDDSFQFHSTSQVKVRNLAQTVQIDFGIDASAIWLAMSEVVANLF